MANKLHGYECFRQVSLTIPKTVTGRQSDEERIIPTKYLPDALVFRTDLNMINEVSFSMYVDFYSISIEDLEGTLKPEIPTSEPFYPLIDPSLAGVLRCTISCGYVENPNLGKYFRGYLKSLTPSFAPDGRLMVSYTFQDNGFDMVKRVVTDFTYPAIRENISDLDDHAQRQITEFTPEFKGTEDDFKNAKSSATKTSNVLDQTYRRPWAVSKKADFTITLYDIFYNIIDSYGFTPDLDVQLKDIVASHKNPIKQQGVTDWLFISSQSEKYGFYVTRQITSTGMTIKVESLADSEKSNFDNSIKFRVLRPGQNLVDYNPLVNKKFIIKDLNIDVSTSGFYSPLIKTFLNEEGETIVAVRGKDKKTEYTNYKINQEAVAAAVNYDPERSYILEIIKGKMTIDDAIAEGFISREVESDSNEDDTDKAYSSYVPLGWTANFASEGNPYSVIGNWYIIEGLGANFLRPIQLISVEDTFSHRWVTTYELKN
ncbi:hypothetical protein Molly5_91 [Maribacter phage Molly_5]|uniref:Tail protein n=2 Tax=Mollyvirus TaxID=2948826 RepID=A0A8E4UY18_9CAUD|nr:hypothetical protein M1M29_gp091 [Maribacter phage Molly_1]YP_010357338.1 hypothetical protein M1M30_gp089 [Maribacter phage Colly_1]QQO97779.1 hypothetical protein Molly2_91 [Maribacter phage Molly_2]QQO97979.1 hypothetical protein Molly3_91 [Maribacter phage Molly_3]QQO98179.1 hypothetical protein Molly4_91 [Maribacter phage Molly_4]QQO98379.1 hypothetical protein Molly5_91 [Maribacter phage Molly_5]QQO97376.1 hypothetical protein Colly1_89 [Maribacter phage Colly_1]